MIVRNAAEVPGACHHGQSGVVPGSGGHKEQRLK